MIILKFHLGNISVVIQHKKIKLVIETLAALKHSLEIDFLSFWLHKRHLKFAFSIDNLIPS